jgi:hypothetical protein
MYETMKYLTQINPPRNYKNVDSLNQVADYIKMRFVYARTPFGHPARHYLASARINTWPAHASYT